MDLGNNRSLQSSSLLQLSVKLTAQTQGAFMFDYQGAGDFKFVAIDAQAKRTIIGHYTDADGWAVDARVTRTINAATDYTLGLSLTGTPANATLTGFMAVNRDQLKALPAHALAELAKTDALELLYLHLQSMRNFSDMMDRLSAQHSAETGALPEAGASAKPQTEAANPQEEKTSEKTRAVKTRK